MIDILTRFYNDLTKLDPSEPTIVYDKNGCLNYMQVGLTIATPYLNHLILMNKKFKYGVITARGFSVLMQSLMTVISDHSLSSGSYSTSICESKLEFYKCFMGLRYPQKFCTIEFVEFTNPIICSIYLRRFSDKSRIILKSVNDDIRKSNKPISKSKSS